MRKAAFLFASSDTELVDTMKPINRFTLFIVGIRATCIMAIWNFERMLNIGFTFCLLPVLRRLYPEKNQRRIRALTRHLQFFNTQPYFASYILGLIAAKEERLAADLAANNESELDRAEQEMQTIKTTLMGPLGALGDTFFWTTIRPFLAVIAVMIVLLSAPEWNLAVVGPLFFIICYNVAHIYIRFYGVFQGYKSGGEMSKLIRQFDLAGTVARIQTVGIGFIGLFIGLAGLCFIHNPDLDIGRMLVLRGWFAFKLLCLSFLVYIGLHKKMHTTRIFIIGLVAMCGYELTQQAQLPSIYGYTVVAIVMMVYFTILFWNDIKGSPKP
ncbi:MAG: PTS system mannose/fructose/sorbose family transporter subunit IID [bacterium]